MWILCKLMIEMIIKLWEHPMVTMDFESCAKNEKETLNEIHPRTKWMSQNGSELNATENYLYLAHSIDIFASMRFCSSSRYYPTSDFAEFAYSVKKMCIKSIANVRYRNRNSKRREKSFIKRDPSEENVINPLRSARRGCVSVWVISLQWKSSYWVRIRVPDCVALTRRYGFSSSASRWWILASVRSFFDGL